jgi:outer membrane protein TolC
LRQKVLLEAKMHLLEIIHLNKKLAVEKERTRQARQVFDQIRELYEKEEVGKLELNKAKISWMQEQFKVQQIKNQKRNELVLLKELNGGNEVVFSQSEYDHALALESLDSLWKDKKMTDPKLATLEQQEKVARQQLKLSKIQTLPDLAAGYNYQGAPSSSFSGLYAGISIPLWNSRNELKAAKTHVRYQESYTQTQTMQSYAQFQKRYNEYQMLLDKLKTYQSTLQDLNSEKLLLESYRLGEISFIEYYMELQFYQQAYDSMLRVENRLNKLKAEILKHQL